jgi:hypothetical protein
VSLFGFSPRGRGHPEPLVPSPLPLSHGTHLHHTLHLHRCLMELPTPPPLPPLIHTTHDKKNETLSSNKVNTMNNKNSTRPHRKESSIITDTSSVTPRTSSDVHFAGKIIHHLPGTYHIDNTTVSIHPNSSALCQESIIQQGTVLRLILSF